MNNPVISVVVPVYNAEKYLACCIDSILSQSLSELELIVVDDGSTDGSLSIAENYAARDKRCRCFHQKNAGQGAARNKGIELAKGKYIAFVDADDWIDSRMYEELFDLAEQHNSDAVYSGVRKVSNGLIAGTIVHPFSGCTLYGDEIYKFRRCLYGPNLAVAGLNYVPIGANYSIYSHKIITDSYVRFDNSSYYEDGFFNIDFVQHASTVTFSNEIFYNYRKDGQESVTTRFEIEIIANTMRMINRLRMRALQEKPEERVLECSIRSKRVAVSYIGMLFDRIDRSSLSRKEKTACYRDIHTSKELNEALIGYSFKGSNVWNALLYVSIVSKFTLFTLCLVRLKRLLVS